MAVMVRHIPPWSSRGLRLPSRLRTLAATGGQERTPREYRAQRRAAQNEINQEKFKCSINNTSSTVTENLTRPADV